MSDPISRYFEREIGMAESEMRIHADMLTANPFAHTLYKSIPLRSVARRTVLRAIQGKIASRRRRREGLTGLPWTAAELHADIVAEALFAAQYKVQGSSTDVMSRVMDRVEASEWATAAEFFGAISDDDLTAYLAKGEAK
jgi:hypothetical protein